MADNIANILMRLSGDSDDADDTLAAFLGKLKAFGGTSAEAKADVNVGGGVSKLSALEAALAKFARTRAVATASVDVKTDNLDAVFRNRKEIEIPLGVDDDRLAFNMQKALVGLSGIIKDHDLSVEPKVNLASGLADLARWTAAVSAADRQEIHVDADVSKVSLATMAIGKLGSLFGQAQEGASKFSQGIGGVTVNLGAFGVKLTATTGIVLALIVAMGVSLIAAAALLVTALASATAAVGALAVAFAAALGPAVALAIGLFTRITKIMEALKAQTDAKAAADRKGAEGTAAAAQAEERRHDAIVAVGQALRAVTSAERGREQAIAAAKEAILQASRDETRAAEDLALATQNTKDQMVAAYEAIADAAEAARDALLDVEQAKLGIEQAALSTKEAQLALKEFREESGLAGKSFNDLFKKFTDIDADVDIKPLMDKLRPSGGDSEESAAIQLQKLILAVQQAKLNEKKATDDLGDSEKNLSDKRKEAAKFAREGIAAFEPYTAAIRAQRDATLRLADATKKSNELEAQGITNNPAVIAATEALINANTRLVEARRNAANAAKGAGGADDAAAAKQKWDELSDAERSFGLGLQKLKEQLMKTFGPGVDAALSGIGRGLAGAGAGLSPLQAAFTKFGDTVGKVFENLGLAVASPAVQTALAGFIDAASQLAVILGQDAFASFLAIILNIATAAMPLLISGSKAFAGWLEEIAGKTKDTKKLNSGMRSIGSALKGVLGLLASLGRVFLAFFAATSGQSKGFVKTLTEMFNKMAAFLNSPKGREAIQQFFKDIVPLAIQTIKFIGNLVIIFLQLVQIVAPALSGLLAAFNFILGVLIRVLAILKPILQIVAQIALFFLGGLPKAVGFFFSKFAMLRGIGALLQKGILGPIASIMGKIAALASSIPEIFDWITTKILSFIDWITGAFGDLLDILLWPFKKLFEFVASLGSKMFEAGKAIVQGVIDGILSVPGKIAKAVVGGLGKIVEMLPGSEPKDPKSPFRGLRDRGKAIMENLSSGIKPGAQDLSRVLHRSLVPVVAGIDATVNLPSPRGGSPLGGGGPQYHGQYVAQQDVNLPPAPDGGLSDPSTQAAMLAMEMRRRGRGR